VLVLLVGLMKGLLWMDVTVRVMPGIEIETVRFVGCLSFSGL
jgi:hypothetical protein